MNFTIIHKQHTPKFGDFSPIEYSLRFNQVRDHLISNLRHLAISNKNFKPLILLPDNSNINNLFPDKLTKLYNGKINIHKIHTKAKDSWTAITNARFLTYPDVSKIQNLLDRSTYKIITLSVKSEMQNYTEKACITPENTLAGFRRIFNPSFFPAHTPSNWPVYIFLKSEILTTFADQGLPLNFKDFLVSVRKQNLTIKNLTMNTYFYDLNDPDSILAFLENNIISQNSKTPNILIGKNVTISKDTILVPPVMIADNLKIPENMIIKNSIIAGNIPKNTENILQDLLVTNGKRYKISDSDQKCIDNNNKRFEHKKNNTKSNFKSWPALSYPVCFKRLIDFILAAAILLLFLPVFPIIALLIKLNSKGPVFFKHKRQGLHGQMFDCIKFRTMIVQADNVQHKLRSKNQVDGPQFKMENDPRITMVGNFLRDTFIDEIPQFINVLNGQMSLIGPRPSPILENMLCPSWRDARLSVRPGITGLWQIYRTRKLGRDFQEWIYYDKIYIEELSFKMDFKIFFLTVKKLISNFVDQF